MNDLDIAYKLNSEMVTFWQFYVAGMSAVVGWVVSRNKRWEIQKISFICIAVVIFMGFSLSGIYRTTSSLHEIVLIMQCESYKIPDSIDPKIFSSVLDRLNSGDWYMHIVPHIAVDLIVIYIICILAKRDPK